MIEIKGKYNQAKIFTDVVDSASIAQVQELCNQEFTAGSRIRLMPDIHAGAGCTIGTWTLGAAWKPPASVRDGWSFRSWTS